MTISTTTTTPNTTIKTLSIVNYKTFAGHDGMRGFNAEIKYKGKKIASVYDDAWGGPYNFTVLGYGTDKYDKNKELYNQLLEEVKGLDKTIYDGLELDPSLESLIAELCSEKDMLKDTKKGILIKTNFGYNIFKWKVQIPTLIKKYSNGLEIVQAEYDKLKTKEVILNKEYLASVGVVV
jgi:hypothetical protein